MSSVFDKLLRRGRVALDGPLDYEQAKALTADGDWRVRQGLAGRPDVRPEILYFLADDPVPEVRREVASNETTPWQADVILARDRDDQVRCDLAHKIARLAPQLSEEERDRAGTFVFEALEILARDRLPTVRRFVAEELKRASNIRGGIIEGLASDDDDSISTPVLQFSPLLSDGFLSELIGLGVSEGALCAISRRDSLSETVSDAVVAADNPAAVTALLSNHGAQIREETLDSLVGRAAGMPVWHAPLVRRPSLSARAIRTLSEFVAETLLDELAARRDIDTETAEVVASAVRQRIGDGEDGPEPAGPGAGSEASLFDKARSMDAAGELTDDGVRRLLGSGERGLAMAVLSLKSGLPLAAVQKVVSLKSTKGMMALAWRSGLSADIGLQIQLRLARIAPTDALQPRNGDFPLSTDEMSWQIDYFSN